MKNHSFRIYWFCLSWSLLLTAKTNNITLHWEKTTFCQTTVLYIVLSFETSQYIVLYVLFYDWYSVCYSFLSVSFNKISTNAILNQIIYFFNNVIWHWLSTHLLSLGYGNLAHTCLGRYHEHRAFQHYCLPPLFPSFHNCLAHSIQAYVHQNTGRKEQGNFFGYYHLSSRTWGSLRNYGSPTHLWNASWTHVAQTKNSWKSPLSSTTGHFTFFSSPSQRGVQTFANPTRAERMWLTFHIREKHFSGSQYNLAWIRCSQVGIDIHDLWADIITSLWKCITLSSLAPDPELLELEKASSTTCPSQLELRRS